MKKTLLFIVLAILLTVSSVYAQDTDAQDAGSPDLEAGSVGLDGIILDTGDGVGKFGVQIIGDKGNGSDVELLDDIKVGSEYEIDGWGIIKVHQYGKSDYFWNNKGYRNRWSDGSSGADTPWIVLYITNITFKPKNYLEGVSVKVVYNDQYEINGWWCQLEIDDNDWIHSSDAYEIDPFYEGHYEFGVSVPDYIVKDTKPLRMEINFGDVQLTYHIRK